MGKKVTFYRPAFRRGVADLMTLRPLRILLAALLLAGCVSTPSPVADPRQVWCDHNAPRRDATLDTPRWELDEINAHNARGVAWCRWNP